MADVEDGEPCSVPPPHLFKQQVAGLGVNAHSWFIEVNDCGVAHQGESQIQPALHATRIGVGSPIASLNQADTFEQFMHLCLEAIA